MRPSSAVVVAVLAACGGTKDDGKKKPAPAKAIEKHTIDHARMAVPEGWVSEYDAAHDTWSFSSPASAGGTKTIVTFDRTPPETTPSPDALFHVMKTRTWGPGVTGAILERMPLSDGFATTIEKTENGQTTREIYAVKELGSEWFLCSSSGADDVTRDQALALCKSIKR